MRLKTSLLFFLKKDVYLCMVLFLVSFNGLFAIYLYMDAYLLLLLIWLRY